MPKLLICLGIAMIIVGVIWYFFGHSFNWIGKLPGDVRIERPNFKFYFPFTTMLLGSALLNLIIWCAKKLLNP